MAESRAGDSGAAADLDAPLRALIARHGLTGDPAIERDLPKISDALAQLGRDLFFSKALSGDKDVACATCHHPVLGGGDGLSLSVGVGALDPDLVGPGRAHDWRGAGARDPRADGAPNVPRNASTTFNVALYDVALFHDGRIESAGRDAVAPSVAPGIMTPDSLLRRVDPDAGHDLVTAQARFPVASAAEMQGFEFKHGQKRERIRDHLGARLGDYGAGRGELVPNRWLTRFQATFDAPSATAEALITFDNIARAIAAYQRSQIFVDTPWRRFVQGDGSALSPAAKRGALLFLQPEREDGANCVACHSGDFFTDEKFHVLATVQIGRGKNNGTHRDHDYGRFKVSRNPRDKFAFRTPTLLNVAVTAPYSHAGAYQTLEEIVRHHLNPADAIARYDFSLRGLAQFAVSAAVYPWARENTEQALQTLVALRADGRSALRNVSMSEQQIADIVEFLRALTDPCVKDPACLAPWLPAAGPGPDGLRLRAFPTGAARASNP